MRRASVNRRPTAFTIIELMVSLTVLTLLAIFSARIYLNYTASTEDLKAANLVYEEARFLMERLVREVRQGAVDYEQYSNQNLNIPLNPGDGYVDNYCEYDSFFYDNGPDGNHLTPEDGESIGRRNTDWENFIVGALGTADAVAAIENELYLMNITGTERTMITRVVKDDGTGNNIGKLAMNKMVGRDFGEDHIDGRESYNLDEPHDLNCAPDEREGDGLIDTWHCHPDYPCQTDLDTNSTTVPGCQGHTHVVLNNPAAVSPAVHSFVDISPNSINVVDIKYIISPKDDPWKGYNIDSIQIQPTITIQLTAEANPRLVTTLADRVPTITLTSTVTTRIYDEIRSPCGY